MERTPDQWRDHLSAKLMRRRPKIAARRNYYDGLHPFPTAPNDASDEYKAFAVLGEANLCSNIVDAVVERLTVLGFSLNASVEEFAGEGIEYVDSADLDEDLWRRFWQGNDLDETMPLAFEEASKSGWAYLLFTPQPGEADPKVTAEDPWEMIVEHAPGDRSTTVAAYKEWSEDSVRYAILQLPTEIFYWRRGGSSAWVDWDYQGAGAVQENTLGEVGVIEMLCRPKLDGTPQPEISKSVCIGQDRLNKQMFDSVVIGDAMAHPQRVAIGIEIEVDENDNEINPLTSGPERVWALNASEEGDGKAQVFQLDAANLEQIIKVAEFYIRVLASQSRTPLYELVGDLINIAADTVHALMTGHIMKVRRHQRSFGGNIEDAARMWLRAVGLGEIDAVAAEVKWLDPELRTWNEKADAATKLKSVGYSFRDIAAMLGETDTRIEQLVQNRLEEQLDVFAGLPQAAQPAALTTGAGDGS